MMYVWRSEGNLWELVFSFCHVDPRDWTPVLRLGSKYPYLLSLWPGQVVQSLRTLHFWNHLHNRWRSPTMSCVSKVLHLPEWFLWPLPLPGPVSLSAVWEATWSVWGHRTVLAAEPCAESRAWSQTLSSMLWHSGHQENSLCRWICERSPRGPCSTSVRFYTHWLEQAQLTYSR